MPPTSPYPSAAAQSTAAARSLTSKATLRNPSSLAMAAGEPGTGSGRTNRDSSSRVPSPGGLSMTISVRECGMQQTVSKNSPSTNVRPSTSRPSATKKAVTTSRSATVTPTWSKRRTCAIAPSSRRRTGRASATAGVLSTARCVGLRKRTLCGMTGRDDYCRRATRRKLADAGVATARRSSCMIARQGSARFWLRFKKLLQQRVGHPAAEARPAPSLLYDQAVVDRWRGEQRHDVGGLLWPDARPQHLFPHEHGYWAAAQDLEALGLPSPEQLVGFGIEFGGAAEGDVELSDPLAHVGDEVGVHGQGAVGVWLCVDPLDGGAVAHRDRLVVSCEGVVVGELEQGGLAADGGEHRLAADAGAGGDRVDRGGGEPVLGEQLSGGRDDATPCVPRLLGAQLAPIAPLALFAQLCLPPVIRIDR